MSALLTWQSDALLAALSALSAHAVGGEFCATGFATDTRLLNAGEVFVALTGAKADGEAYLAQAKAKGAVAAIVREAQEIDLPQIIVSDTLKALQILARCYRDAFKGKVVAITGSNGKTTTKEILARILSKVGQTHFTKGNYNNDIGVPLTLFALEKAHEFAVIEIGANHQGEVARLTELVRPDVAVVTNVSAAHLQGFGDLAGVIAAKSEIYQHSHQAVVINLETSASAHWLAETAGRKCLTYALSDAPHNAPMSAQVTASHIAPDGSRFRLNFQHESIEIAWQLRGKHMIANALCASSAALLLGVELTSIGQALMGLSLAHGRLTARSYGKHTVYDDTYNANPASFYAAIDLLRQHRPNLLIAGEMAELGKESVALHQQVGAYAREKGIDALWVVGEKALAYAQGFEGGAGEVRVFASACEAAKALAQQLSQSEVSLCVVVKGSRCARMETVFETLALS